MKNENEFNAYLSKEFRKLGPGLKALKTSDKFHIGVSDFLMWYKGRSVAMEVKFIKNFTGRMGRLLTHPFTGPQMTFFKTHDMAGSMGWGLIGCQEERIMVPIQVSFIPPSGNWETQDFVQNCKGPVYDFNEIECLVHHLFL